MTLRDPEERVALLVWMTDAKIYTVFIAEVERRVLGCVSVVRRGSPGAPAGPGPLPASMLNPR